ncbi:MAG: DegT/DnrJ/EryC1/StrS family aminotransferase [Meiothermus sp.]|nr:DegT/DnrJ/EryC1/StrS family aminotransferase [Meiothermus sp.]
MTVPMYDHAGRYRQLQAELDAAVRRVLESGRPDWGEEVPGLEREFAALAGAGHAVGCNSGTAALRLALLALGVGPGDEVITAPNSDAGTASAIHHVGARPVYVDVEADTLNLDPELLEAAITPATRAILPVHLYGHPADMPRIMEIARRHGLLVVEDACLALGSSVAGRKAGLWGDIGCFSFASTKHLGGFGSGGICVTNNPELAERMELFVGYGQPRARVYDKTAHGQLLLVEGVNERLDELQAALLRAQLPHVPEWTARRIQHAEAYTAALAGPAIQTPTVRPGCVHTFRNYVIRLDQRDAVQQKLLEAGITTTLAYVPPLHLQPAYARPSLPQGSFPVAEAACERLLCLPVSPQLRDEQRAYVTETLLEIVGGSA